jgi:hypothetical protein
MKRSDIAKTLWYDFMQADYYQSTPLAQEEYDLKNASHSAPFYDSNSQRMSITHQNNCYQDDVYKKNGYRDDHFALRCFIVNTKGVGSQLQEGIFLDSAVWGNIKEDYIFTKGIILFGRIMNALGYKRGKTNIGNAYYNLAHHNTDIQKTLYADAVHLEAPDDAIELPRQFISQLHIENLKFTHPKLAAYIIDLMFQTKDPFADKFELLEKLHTDHALTEDETEIFLKAAYSFFKTRAWIFPFENAKNFDEWQNALNDFKAVLEEHENLATESSQYALWTLLNGTCINHIAYLTGNIWDTMLYHILKGRKIIDPIGQENSHISDINSEELGGLLQASVIADKKKFIFKSEFGQFEYEGQGAFVEYIERPVVFKNNQWHRINDAFLPSNAKQIFQSTMDKTRNTQSWSVQMQDLYINNLDYLYTMCKEKNWTKSLSLFDTKFLHYS